MIQFFKVASIAICLVTTFVGAGLAEVSDDELLLTMCLNENNNPHKCFGIIGDSECQYAPHTCWGREYKAWVSHISNNNLEYDCEVEEANSAYLAVQEMCYAETAYRQYVKEWTDKPKRVFTSSESTRKHVVKEFSGPSAEKIIANGHILSTTGEATFHLLTVKLDSNVYFCQVTYEGSSCYTSDYDFKQIGPWMLDATKIED